MPRARIVIPEHILRQLYLKEHWSPAKIGARFNCDAVTVRTRIREANIPLKSKSEAQTHYFRQPYTGSELDKAYMLGFRYGDLNAYKPKGASMTIVVRSHTTKRDQCRVFSSLFSKYGVITTSSNERTAQMTCYLDTSFEFLLDKYPSTTRNWMLKSKRRMSAFAAGYVDAEGTFGLNQGKGRFKIDAYDYEILKDLYESFLQHKLRAKFRAIAKKGENDYGWEWKRDLWRLEINEASSLEQLIKHIMPYQRHAKRIKDANMVLQNIRARRLHGSIK